MIFGVGIDLVNIPRMEAVLKRWGERFVNRVFTGQEARTCYPRVHPAASFALRFAAKEAFSKAIGLGMRKGIRWRDIEVFRLPGQAPTIELYGSALARARKMGLGRLAVSLSHSEEYAVAFVVGEREGE